MADIDFYQEDSDDTSDSSLGLDDVGGLDDDCYGPDDHLSPLQKLEKYMNSDNIFSRQMVAKSMLDTLRAVGEERDEWDAVLKAMVRLSDDAEATVRSELMEQVPHVAMYCLENKHIFDNSVPIYILPMVVKYLNDMNNQVRKTSQAALLVLLEQELVDKQDIQEQVVGVISDLARPDSPDDFRTEAVAGRHELGRLKGRQLVEGRADQLVTVADVNAACQLPIGFLPNYGVASPIKVALMSKMAPLLGREMTEAQFLPRFCEMCTDSLFHVRKVCAANFGDICSVVGPESVEEYLLPKFYFLCEDGVWGVRKACAECFMAVSRACTSETRRSQLSAIFVNLLSDLSRWVRIAAFQALGPFISTYADPRIMELLIQEGITSVEGEITCDINAEPLSRKEAGHHDDKVDQDTDESKSNSEEKSEDNVGETIQATSEQETNSATEDMEIDSSCDDSAIVANSVEDASNINASDVSVEEKRFEKYKQKVKNSSDLRSDSKKKSSEEVSYNTEQSEVGGPSQVPNEKEASPAVRPAGESPTPELSNICDTNTLTPQLSHESNVVDVANKTDDDKSIDSSAKSEVAKPETCTVTSEASEDGHVHIHVDNVAANSNYNAFQFWRTPIPAVDLDLDIINGAPANIHLTARVTDEDSHKVYATQMDISVRNQNNSGEHTSVSTLEVNQPCIKALGSGSSETSLNAGVTIHTASVSTVSETTETVSNIGSTHVLGQNLKDMCLSDNTLQDIVGSNLSYSMDSDSLSSAGSSMKDSAMFDDSVLSQQQDVIPPHLLEHYLSMVDPSRAQTVDTEITRHCAYSLPAVAFTLGRKNWPCLKILYETLASDMQWKVRRTLAFSIHELALIVGEEITHEDLVPVFDGFLKDLDEVRIGVLKHFSDFLRLLRPDVRQSYLPRVQDFLTTDNQRNWRFRMELADQLIILCELFSGREICEHLVPIAMNLVGDKVAEVRQISCRLLAVMMRRLWDEHDERMVSLLVTEMTERFAQSNKWYGRQLYAQLCLCLLEENSMSQEDFAGRLLPSLLHLATDSIPNVRISLAKTLAQMVIPSDYFTSYQNPHHDELLKSIQSLKSDSDKDVRYFSSHSPEQTSRFTDNVPV